MGKSRLYTGLRKGIERGFLKIAPYGKTELSRLTNLCLIKVWAAGTMIGMLLLILNFIVEKKVSIISLSLVIICIYILLKEMPEHILSRKYEAFQKELLQYLSTVKTRYIYSKSVLDAIDSASYDFSIEVQKNAAEIMRIMLSGHRRERVKGYIKNCGKDPYLKLFLIQAHEASENGDSQMPDGDSMFCKNMDLLRTEVMKGIYERKKRRFMFSGYLFVAVFPVIMIPLVQRTGLSLSEKLDIFYLGTGNFIVVLAYLALLAVYNVVSDFKGGNLVEFGIQIREKEYFEVNPNGISGKSAKIKDKINEKQSRRLLWLDKKIYEAGQNSSRFMIIMRGFLYGMIVFVLGVIFINLQYKAEKKALTSSIGNIDDIAVMTASGRKKTIEQGMLKTIDRFKDSSVKGSSLEEEVYEYFTDIIPGASEQINKSATSEIISRIEIYRSLYLHWYQILILDTISVLAGFIPVMQLCYRAHRRKEGITEEVKRLQTVVIMERGLANIGTCELLENLEMFSDVFRDNIQDALNLYQAGAENALMLLREEGGRKSYEFKELAEDFMAISDVGIYQAFSSVEADRQGLEIMTELSEEIMTSGKKNLMDVFSWIPGIIVMMGYLIVPFLRIAMSDLSEVFTMMEEIQMW